MSFPLPLFSEKGAKNRYRLHCLSIPPLTASSAHRQSEKFLLLAKHSHQKSLLSPLENQNRINNNTLWKFDCGLEYCKKIASLPDKAHSQNKNINQFEKIW